MNHLADGAQAPRSQERPAAELVKELSEQVSVLVREEVKLARLEVTRKGKQAGVGAGMLGGAGPVTRAARETADRAAWSPAWSWPSAPGWRGGWPP